jgi:hydrogenase expression/formation protein HypC
MCLAVPGQIIEISGDQPEIRVGRVRFGGIVKDVNLAFVPEARQGDYVLVHVGFAITRIDQAEAVRVFEYLKEIDSDEIPR